MHIVNEMLEGLLPRYRDEGFEFVVVYRHGKDPDLRFYNTYKTFYEMSGAKRYWKKHNYWVNATHVLDDRSEREKRRTRRKNLSTIGD